MPRLQINPPLSRTFDEVYRAISTQPRARTPELSTTGGVRFVAGAAVTQDGRRFVSLPHSNRIYEDDWGYRSNSMGKDGQRIGQYSVPIDEWASRL
jgi:phosphoribosylformylglycinamidine (FGAM) synthase-like amidotransferase family enzyme